MSERAVQKIIDRAWEPAARAEADPEIDTENACQCCGMNPSVGVAAVPGVPMSIAWCEECLRAGIVPLWVCFAQATMGIDDRPPEFAIEIPQVDRAMFGEWWLEWHDRTLTRFGVTEEEFWTAVNEPPAVCGPTDDDMFCACGCGGDDSRCETYMYYYRASPDQVPAWHVCCKITGRG